MKFKDSGWSGTYFDMTVRRIGHYRLSIGDYGALGCDAIFEDGKTGKLVEKSFLDGCDEYCQSKAEKWLLAQVPADMIDHDQASYSERAIKARRRSHNFENKTPKEPKAKPGSPSSTFRSEIDGIHVSTLHLCRLATHGKCEPTKDPAVIAEAQALGLCLPNARIFTPTIEGLQFNRLMSALQCASEEKSREVANECNNLAIMRLALVYMTCSNWRLAIRRPVEARIAELEQQTMQKCG